LENTPITYAHIFSYSDRPYASSKKLKNKIDPQIIKNRSKMLHIISDKKRFDFYKKCITYTNEKNNYYSVVIEKIEESVNNNSFTPQIVNNDIDNDNMKCYYGFTENYIPIYFYSSSIFNKGDLIENVRLVEVDIKNESIYAKI